MGGRSVLPALLVVLAVGAVTWFLLGREGGGPRPAAPASDSETAQRPPDAAPAPTDVPTRPDDWTATPPATHSVAPKPAGPTRPEMFTIERASWTGAPAIEVLEDVVRRTGYVLRLAPGAREMLKDAKVTLAVENEKAHMVVGKVILPYDLDFTIREGELRIFVDDD